MALTGAVRYKAQVYADGNNGYTATAEDAYGRTAQDSVTGFD